MLIDNLHHIMGAAWHDPHLLDGELASLELDGQARGLDDALAQQRAADGLEGVGQDVAALLVEVFGQARMAEKARGVSLKSL